MERRNFVSVVPAAKKSKIGPIFFQNICVIYKLSVKKQKTGRKTNKNPPKKVFFSSPSDQLAEFGWIWSDHIQPGWIWSDQIQPGWIWPRPNPARLDMVRSYPASGWIWSDHIQPQAGYGQTIFRQTEPAGRRGWEKTPF